MPPRSLPYDAANVQGELRADASIVCGSYGEPAASSCWCLFFRLMVSGPVTSSGQGAKDRRTVFLIRPAARDSRHDAQRPCRSTLLKFGITYAGPGKFEILLEERQQEKTEATKESNEIAKSPQLTANGSHSDDESREYSEGVSLAKMRKDLSCWTNSRTVDVPRTRREIHGT
ncbi:hypothetical protein CB1_000350048 [Camelus ferus]|nr:hypothetical protein CB1_000350048 [Camelus ferus]